MHKKMWSRSAPTTVAVDSLLLSKIGVLCVFPTTGFWQAPAFYRSTHPTGGRNLILRIELAPLFQAKRYESRIYFPIFFRLKP